MYWNGPSIFGHIAISTDVFATHILFVILQLSYGFLWVINYVHPWLQTDGIYVHADDATGLKGFQEVLGSCRRGNNKECMAKLLASELRGSEESGNEEAMNMSKPQVWHTKRQKNQLWPATLETWNSFNSLYA